MNTAVAFRADFDATFPDLKTLNEGDDRLPGRPVAELVANGLRKRGLQTSEVENEEPFFVTKCRSGAYEYSILSYSVSSDDFPPAWGVEFKAALGFWGKLSGKSEENEMLAVAEAIHETLKSDSRVQDIRWYVQLPLEPFKEGEKYGATPQA